VDAGDLGKVNIHDGLRNRKREREREGGRERETAARVRGGRLQRRRGQKRAEREKRSNRGAAEGGEGKGALTCAGRRASGGKTAATSATSGARNSRFAIRNSRFAIRNSRFAIRVHEAIVRLLELRRARGGRWRSVRFLAMAGGANAACAG
jgi:hypothetical protein